MRNRGDGRESRTHGLVWGLILIGMGVVFLLTTYGQLPWDFMSTWWAVFPIGAGLAKLVTARDPREFGSGVTTLGIGCWLLVAANGWYGLGWSRSWPLVLVAVGLGTLAQAVAASMWRYPEDDHVS